MCKAIKEVSSSKSNYYIMNTKKKGEHYNITIRAIGRLYNGRPKFACNVYLTL